LKWGAVAIFNNIEEAENFIYSSYMNAKSKMPKGLQDMTKRNPDLARLLLGKIGEPDKKQRNVLVTGSKGKGSASRMISKLIEAHGFKAGLFTSPHLISFLERIRINGNAISESDFVKYASILKPDIDEMQKQLTETAYIGPVGITAAIAMLYYLDKNTDLNVLECGKGARFDDVSMIHSEISVINTIFPEHIPELGGNLAEIAFEKAGIINSTQKCTISAGQQKDVYDVIYREAHGKGVKLLTYGNDFVCENISVNREGTYFDVITKNNEYRGINLNLLGRHQAYNAALAVCTAENLISGIKKENIKQAFGNLSWPGRLEIISKSPLTILDGCINRECARYVREVVKEIGSEDIITIIGIPDDKDYEGVTREMNDISKKVIYTKAKNKHLKFTEEQIERAKSILGSKFSYEDNIEDAVSSAYNSVNGNELICILGTQSLVRDTKECFKQDTLNLK